MATPNSLREPAAGSRGDPGGSGDDPGAVDWEAVERSPEFQRLVSARRRFVIPATAFFLAWYIGFILLAGYAEGFMGRSLYQGFTVGYALALTQFLMTWGLGWMYLRRADREFDPLAEAAAERASRSATAAPGGEPGSGAPGPMGIGRPAQAAPEARTTTGGEQR